MTLTDIVSGAGAALLPSIALVIFVCVFAGVLARLFAPSQRAVHQRHSRLPLNDETPLGISTKEQP